MHPLLASGFASSPLASPRLASQFHHVATTSTSTTTKKKSNLAKNQIAGTTNSKWRK
jgi:hypothetical protein